MIINGRFALDSCIEAMIIILICVSYVSETVVFLQCSDTQGLADIRLIIGNISIILTLGVSGLWEKFIYLHVTQLITGRNHP